MKAKVIGLWIMQLAVAGILLWTAWSKLSSKPTGIFIFSELGMEPTGRYIIGIVELTAALCLLNKRVAAIGGLLALGTMLGAIIAHLSVLGANVQGDDGKHIMLLAFVFLCALSVTILRRRQLPFIGSTFDDERLPYS